ncbi:phosphoribosyltransferase family protein [Deltaproteobacteria bacterium TL4]
MEKTLIVSNVSDASFAMDVAYAHGQKLDISDLIALKSFANSEFCPRFLLEDVTEENLGKGLEGKSVYIISTASPHYTRNELAMRNFLIARAAKENGAEFVALVEPDLFYSAQDRGPRTLTHPQVTDFKSREKFVGQPCTAELYARLLKDAGVDLVMTVHNHKPKVLKTLYEKIFQEAPGQDHPRFINLDISPLVANYILRSGLARLSNYGENVGFIAPDDGAVEFVQHVRMLTGLKNSILVNMKKTRHSQREVEIDIAEEVSLLKNKDVFILDDMVRTGGTIAANVKLLSEDEHSRPANIFFYCTHTYISPEGRENLYAPELTQFITTNTIPNILNRDDQGRLRKKTIVIKIEKWIANAILCFIEQRHGTNLVEDPSDILLADRYYDVDFSYKNKLLNKARSYYDKSRDF